MFNVFERLEPRTKSNRYLLKTNPCDLGEMFTFLDVWSLVKEKLYPGNSWESLWPARTSGDPWGSPFMYRIVLRNDITELYYGVILQNILTDSYSGMMLQNCITNYITEL